MLNLPLPAQLRLKSGTRDAMVPFQNVMSLLLYRARGALRLTARAEGVRAERDRLLADVATLRYRLRQVEVLERENAELREQVAFRRRQNGKLLLCEVIVRGDCSGWWQTVTLNRGRDDGVRPEMPVITLAGLVGRVAEVSRRTSQVRLLTEPGSRVACRLLRAGVFGIARGAGAMISGKSELDLLCVTQPLQLDYVSKDSELNVGDAVVTAGLGGGLPEGLVVGYVRDFELDASGLYQRARVVPAVDLARLHHVFVVQEWAPEPAQEPAAGGEEP
jgi:rod shape-determining protein MreC